MTNFIFISPNFPTNYYLFCQALKRNGINVLGIGDCPYDLLSDQVKDSLVEYYRVNSLENEAEVFQAVAFFQQKYHTIDWLESNNEYWLEKDAKLRSAFQIKSGFQMEDMAAIKHKSMMKQYYQQAGIPVARYHLVDDYASCIAFIEEVGYPIIVKPDNGVGASETYKLNNLDEFHYFFATKHPETTYIMEEFIFGRVDSYDAIINNQGQPLFETGTISPISIMDIVNDDDNAVYYIDKHIPDDLREAGRRTVTAFQVKNRFVHFEFFRLTQNMPHLGKVGDIVGLEVNMRPCGGITPDMMNYAYSTDVYQIWADMIAFGHSRYPIGQQQYCTFAGRRDGKNFVYSHEALYAKYGSAIRISQRVDDALASTMGNQMYLAVFDQAEEMEAFNRDVILEA